MILPIKDAFLRIAEEVSRLGEAEKRILQYIHPFKDPKFDFSGRLAPYVYDGARRLFEQRFLYAFQLVDDGYREIPFYEWEDPVTAYSILGDGFYLNNSIYQGSLDRKPHLIYVDDCILNEIELRKMLKVVLAFCQPLGDRSSIFQNLGNSVAGRFEPTDPGIPKEGIRLCDGFEDYIERRFYAIGSAEQFIRDIDHLLNIEVNRNVVAELRLGSEALRRQSLASREFKLALAKGELSVFVRSKNFSVPISVPSAMWWVTNDFSDATEHQILHMDSEDRLSAYNGAAPFLDRHEFRAWLDNQNLLTEKRAFVAKRRAGRHKGKDFYPEDEGHIETIHTIIQDKKVSTFAEAFRMIETHVSGASVDAKRRRLQAKYNKRYAHKNGN